MCTVTVLPVAPDAHRMSRVPLIRLVCNRDEQRSRPVSSGPVRRRLGNRTAIMPIDPPSGGTWLGASDSGLVACLLNANPPVRPGTTLGRPLRSSRGTIVPALLAAETLEDARELTNGLDVTRFPPFRVLVLNAESFFVASSDGATLMLSHLAILRSPLLLTSSGLGDNLVEHPRRDLFDRMMSSTPDSLAAQERFHTHRWNDNPHLSVLMSRSDARTVSRSVVDVLPQSIVLSYSHLNDRLVAGHQVSRCKLSVRRTEMAA